MTNLEGGIKGSDISDLIGRCLAAAISTRNRNWNDEEYQKGVAEPFRRVQKVFLDVEHNHSEPGIQHAREALEMVKCVFITKKLSREEQIQWFENILKSSEMCRLFSEYLE